MAIIKSISLTEEAVELLNKNKVDNLSSFVNMLILDYFKKNELDILLKEYEKTLKKLFELRKQIEQKFEKISEKKKEFEKITEKESVLKKHATLTIKNFEPEDVEKILKTPDNKLIELIDELREKYGVKVSVTDLLTFKKLKLKQKNEL